jgi:hypothetical protein
MCGPARRHAAAGALACVLAASAGLAGCASGRSPDARSTGSLAAGVASESSSAATSLEAGRALTAALGEALVAADGDAAAALAAPGADDVRDRLRAMAENTAVLRLADLDVAYVPGAGSVGDRWSASWQLTWRLPADPGPATVALPVELRWLDGRALVDELGAGAARVPLWVGGPVQRREGRGWQVVAADDAQGAGEVAAAIRTARRTVADLLHVADVVVEMPGTAEEYAASLGAPVGEFDAMAAVTTTADGSTRRDAPMRIVVNPRQLTAMGGRGLTVVLAHETVHVVMRDATAAGPRWLSEGFADYVALRALGLREPLGAAAAEARAHGVPRVPASDADLGSAERSLEAAYQRSWLACDVIVERVGLRRLVELRQATAAGRPFPAALVDITGLRSSGFRRAWQVRLAGLGR